MVQLGNVAVGRAGCMVRKREPISSRQARGIRAETMLTQEMGSWFEPNRIMNLE
jgi:hypothetical protein